MTRRGALGERLDLIPRTLDERDARGNEVPAAGEPITGVPASVELTKSTEDTDDRNAQTVELTATIPVRWRGAELALDSFEAVVYRGDTYELVGPTLELNDHAGRRDHLELTARRIVG